MKRTVCSVLISVLMIVSFIRPIAISQERRNDRQKVSYFNGAVYYDGKIDGVGLVKVQAMISKRSPRVFVIRSGGGDALSAIALTNTLNRNGIQIVTVEKCHSACATFIGLGAIKLSVLPGTLFAFHNSTLGMTAFAGTREIENHSSVDDTIIETARAERLFAIVWLLGRSELFIEVFAQLEPVCFAGFETDENGTIRHYSFGVRHNYWLPSEEAFLTLRGKSFDGEWQTPKVIERSTDPVLDDRYRFGELLPLEIGKLPNCQTAN